MLTTGIPNILKLDSVDYVGIVRELPFTPSCMIDKALTFAKIPSNFYTIPSTLPGRHGDVVNCFTIYVNTTEEMAAGKPVTEQRVGLYEKATSGTFKSKSVTSYVAAGHRLHRVFIRDDPDADCETNGNECDCFRFWQMRTCPHYLAALHHVRWMDIAAELSTSHPANKKRGRPGRQ